MLGLLAGPAHTRGRTGARPSHLPRNRNASTQEYPRDHSHHPLRHLPHRQRSTRGIAAIASSHVRRKNHDYGIEQKNPLSGFSPPPSSSSASSSTASSEQNSQTAHRSRSPFLPLTKVLTRHETCHHSRTQPHSKHPESGHIKQCRGLVHARGGASGWGDGNLSVGSRINPVMAYPLLASHLSPCRPAPPQRHLLQRYKPLPAGQHIFGPAGRKGPKTEFDGG